MTYSEITTLRPAPGGRDILVAMDPSQHSWDALVFAISNIFRPADAITIFRVLSVQDQQKTSLDTTNYRTEEMTALHARISQYLEDSGHVVRFRIHALYAEDPKKAILDKINAKSKYAMLVVGSRGQSHLKGLLLGSVSAYLLNECPIPVVLSRHK